LTGYRAGLRWIRGSCYAWLQPDGGWGLSNAGLVVGRTRSLLVDTLFDLQLTQAMLDAMREHTAQAPIDRAVITHGNGDHWFGNELLGDIEIIAAAATAIDMRAVAPADLIRMLAIPGETGDYIRRVFGRYRFEGINPAHATTTYESHTELSFNGIDVELFDVGPAHTRGDTIVHVVRDRVVYAGDIVFAGGTPVMWEGPLDNWLRACLRIGELGNDIAVVPGHGPLTTTAELARMADYLDFVYAETYERHARGMTANEAASDIELGDYATWPDWERLAVNVQTIYRNLGLGTARLTGTELFGCMADLYRAASGREE
jgi:cyclase